MFFILLLLSSSSPSSSSSSLQGQIVPRSSVLLSYGGDDITELLLWLLQHDPQHFFSYKHCNLQCSQDWLQLQTMKEQICRFHPQDSANKLGTTGFGALSSYQLRERCPGRQTRVHRFNLTLTPFIVPRALFSPLILKDQSGGAEELRSRQFLFEEV
jgi:hypothetical protein